MNANNTTGYSGTPLARKLGYKPGDVIYLDGAPENYLDLVVPLPENLTFRKRLTGGVDLIHIFTRDRAELGRKLPGFMNRLNPGGAIWVSWPKRTSKVPTDVTEDLIRDVALPLGLVDVKVCAVDDVWSGLKLVRRKK